MVLTTHQGAAQKMKNLLFVENDLVVLKVWQRFFCKRLNVFKAQNVVEALRELQENKIDLAILDLRLNGPTPSGLEVYLYIRNELKSKMPVMFVTGLASAVDLHKKAMEYVEADTAAGIYTKLVMKPINVFDDPEQPEQPGILRLIEDMTNYK
jgi:CheY-like chemotaxis protein